MHFISRGSKTTSVRAGVKEHNLMHAAYSVVDGPVYIYLYSLERLSVYWVSTSGERVMYKTGAY